MLYMANKLGAWQVDGGSQSGNAGFKIFFPSGADPQIKTIQVAGDFQSKISANADWDFAHGFPLTSAPVAEGVIWSTTTPKPLPAGFYQYKYLVTFKDGSTRQVSDPCARYGGTENQNAGFAIGGSQPAANAVTPLKGGRLPNRDLIIYELMIDDFTDGYLDDRAPLQAVVDRLDTIAGLGFNAILFMPWTTWTNTDFDWGYDPFQYFAVEYRYANTFLAPSEKLSWLKNLVSECHSRGIHVIMDGVYNHTNPSFAYPSFYLNPGDCPYTAQSFGGSFPGLLDLDFTSPCTNDFILDVCKYWIDTFGIDGIRFDNAINYYVANNVNGLPDLLQGIQAYIAGKGEQNFSLTLEYIDLAAASVTNTTAATSFWDNSLFGVTFGSLWNNQIDANLLNALNNQQYLNTTDKVPTLYLSNHDHSQVCWQAGASQVSGAVKWYKVQPYIIALYTGTAVPLVPNGQEIGEDHWVPEDDGGTGRRVTSRPIRWKLQSDNYGKPLGQLFTRMGQIRNQYPALRSANFYPQTWATWQTQFNPQGYGLDTTQQVAIYHRWGNDANGNPQYFIIVLNFSDQPQQVNVPFPDNGIWIDLLSGYNGTWQPQVSNFQLNMTVEPNWGHVFFK